MIESDSYKLGEVALVQRAYNLIELMIANTMAQKRQERADSAVQLAGDMVKHQLLSSFAGFEFCLRLQDEDPGLYFIGVPKDHFGEEWARRTVYPWDVNQVPDYTLFVATDEEEANALYDRYDLTPDINMLRLCFTGLLDRTRYC